MADSEQGQLGLDLDKNALILQSKVLTRRIVHYEKSIDLLLSDYIKIWKNTDTSSHPSINARVQDSIQVLRSLMQAVKTIISQIKSVASDTEFETHENNCLMISELINLLNSREFTTLHRQFINATLFSNNQLNPSATTFSARSLSVAYGIRSNIKDIPKHILGLIRQTQQYIAYKQREETLSSRTARQGILRGSAQHLRQKGVGDFITKAKRGIESKVGIDRHDSTGTRARKIGGLALGGLGFFAAAYFKSPALAVGATLYLKKRQDVIEKNRELYKKRLNDLQKQREIIQDAARKSIINQSRIEKSRALRSDGFISSELSRFGGGTNQTILHSKKNQIVVGGDNPTGKELINVDGQKSITNGLTAIKLDKGSLFSAKPIGPKGTTVIKNPSSFSKFGGGTGFEDDDKSKNNKMDELVSIAQKQLTVLQKISLDNYLYYDHMIEDMADQKNRFKGGSRSESKMPSQAEVLKEKVKEKGLIGGVIDTIKDIAIGAVLAKLGLKGGVGTLISKGIEFAKGASGKIFQKIGLSKSVPFNPEVLPAKSSGILTRGMDYMKGAGGKLIEKTGLSGLASKGIGLSKGIGGRIPLIGGIVSGGATLMTGGSMSEAAGSGIGAIAGGVLGSIGGPLGTIVGSMAGEFIGKKMGGLFNKQNKREDDKTKTQEELLNKQEEGQTGFLEQLTSSDNPLLKGIGNIVVTTKQAIQSGSQAYSEARASGKGIFESGKVAVGAAKDKLFQKRYEQFAPDVKAAAQANNVSEGYMKAMMKIESGGDPNAVSSTGASGLYQFTKGTAKGYGIRGKEFDPKSNIEAAAKLARDNKKALEKRGIQATDANLYLAHQQGVGGVSALMKAAESGVDPSTIVVDKKRGTTLRQNMDVNGGKGMDAKQFLAFWQEQYHKKAKEAGVSYENGNAVVNPTNQVAQKIEPILQQASTQKASPVQQASTQKGVEPVVAKQKIEPILQQAPTQKGVEPVQPVAEKKYSAGDLFNERKSISGDYDSKRKILFSKFQSGTLSESDYTAQSKVLTDERATKMSAIADMTAKAEKGQWVTETEFNQKMNIGKKQIGNIPAQIDQQAAMQNASNINVVANTKKEPIPQSDITTYNSKIQESKVEIAQAKMQQTPTEKTESKAPTVINNVSSNQQSAGPKNINLSSGDSSWVTTLIKMGV